MRRGRRGTYEVNHPPDVVVDRHVRPRRELVVRRQPRRERRMRKDELALGQGLTERLRECRHPRLGRSVTLVHRGQVLVVHVDPVKLVRGHELRHRVRRRDRVCALCRRLVCLAECGDDDVDPCLGVFGLLGRTLVGGERGECASLVECAVEGQEGERHDVVALGKQRIGE